MVIVRNYIPGEPLPPLLSTGYEQGRCDARWIWLAHSIGEDGASCPVAILVAAPAHITVVLMRLAAVDDAPPTAISTLLHSAMRECLSRGYQSYVTWINPQKPAEASLLHLIRKGGRGVQLTEPQVACMGLTEGA